MTKAAEKLFADLMALDPDVQVEFYEMLREKMEISTDPEYVAAWDAEIQSRLEDIESGNAKMIPWEQALDMIRRGHVEDETT